MLSSTQAAKIAGIAPGTLSRFPHYGLTPAHTGQHGGTHTGHRWDDLDLLALLALAELGYLDANPHQAPDFHRRRLTIWTLVHAQPDGYLVENGPEISIVATAEEACRSALDRSPYLVRILPLDTLHEGLEL